MKQIWRARKRRNSPLGTLASGVLFLQTFPLLYTRLDIHTAEAWTNCFITFLPKTTVNLNFSFIIIIIIIIITIIIIIIIIIARSRVNQSTDYIFLPHSYVCKCLILMF